MATDESKRCHGTLRGFCAGRCESAGSVERDGKLYCRRHDPAPVVPSGEPEYVWEVWCHSQLSSPIVKRFRLVKRNAKGGPTVLVRGFPQVLRPAHDKRHFFALDKLRAYLRTWVESECDRAGRKYRQLSDVLEKNDPDSGFAIEHVRDDCPPLKEFKT